MLAVMYARPLHVASPMLGMHPSLFLLSHYILLPEKEGKMAQC
jgi:hypothetical protein